MLARLAFVSLVLSAGNSLRAAEASEVVAILAPSEDEARARVTALVDVKLYARVSGFPHELPKVMEPGALVGAPKDKWVVVLSICRKSSDAKKRAAAVRDRAKDVTVFRVRGGHADLCLPKRALEPFSEEESALVQGVLKDPAHAKPRTRYATFLQAKNRLEEAEAQLKMGLEVEPEDFEAKNLLQVMQVMRQP